MNYDAIVIGSGLSGLSCAHKLIQRGKKVLVLESRDVVGGRTSSWMDQGMYVESGLHRMLGFYEALPRLMEASGINLDKAFFWEDAIEIKLPDKSFVSGISLRKPVKTLLGLLGNNDFISPKEKLILSKFLVKGFRDLKNKKYELDKLTVKEYAKKNNISDALIFKVLTPLTEGLFFIPPDKYSAYNLFSLFSPYLLKLYKTGAGAFSGGMTEVMAGPIADSIVKKGGEVKLNSKVEKIISDGKGVSGVVINKKEIKSKNIILATSLVPAQQLVRSVSGSGFENLLKLRSMPSVTFQLELNKPSLSVDRVTFSPGTIFASYSEQSRTTFKDSSGRLSIILSQPEKYLNVSKQKILEVVLNDAKKLKIKLEKGSVIDYRKIIWKDDFYSYSPGNAELVPSQETPVKGLYLAGDYTRQKYLQTMEGAVVSGEIVSELIK